MAAKELIGARFEKLLVIGREANAPDGSARWRCVCDCGEQRVIFGTALRADRHRSCGCASPRFNAERLTTHGMSRTRTYTIWVGMRNRCSNSARGKSRALYFEKGIRVCARWESFECFLADMGKAPAGLTIERANGSKGYSKSNCRWATPREQANNTTRNSIVTHGGVTATVATWADRIGVKPNTLVYRLRRGIPLERALSVDIGFIKSAEVAARRRPCAVCGQEFVPRSTQLRAGRGLYCSHKCHGIASKKS